MTEGENGGAGMGDERRGEERDVCWGVLGLLQGKGWRCDGQGEYEGVRARAGEVCVCCVLGGVREVPECQWRENTSG